MPTYEYAIIKPDGTLGEPFEVFQSMSAPHLKKHPETGEPVKRLVSAPGLALNHSDASDKSVGTRMRRADHSQSPSGRTALLAVIQNTGHGACRAT